MKAFLTALGFLTRIPVPWSSDEGDWRKSPLFYPWVGLVIGLLITVFDGVVAGHFPPLVRAVLIVGCWVWITGGLHLDGLMDTADGLGSWRDRDRTLAIMKDSRVGAMGVLAALLVLMLKGAVLASVPGSVAVPVLSATVGGRCGLLIALYGWPYLREKGMGNGLKEGLTPVRFLAAVGAGAGMMAGWAGWTGLLLAGVAAVTAGGVSFQVHRRLGGLTGDVYGAVVEVTETVVLLGWLCWNGG